VLWGRGKVVRWQYDATASAKLFGVSEIIDENLVLRSALSSVEGDDGGSINILNKKEGVLEVEASSKKGFTFNTFIRNYPGWVVTVDDKPYKYSDGLFIKVEVPSGFHKINAVYRPLQLYIGIAISILMLAAWGLINVWLLNRQHANSK
jgi:uncharacterized membrane protein YfhO